MSSSNGEIASLRGSLYVKKHCKFSRQVKHLDYQAYACRHCFQDFVNTPIVTAEKIMKYPNNVDQ